MSVFIDTGVFFAFLVARDANHAAAREMLSNVARGRLGVLYTSDLVVAELFALINARPVPPETGRRARALLWSPRLPLRGLTLLSLGVDGIERAAVLWEQLRKHQLSFADAATILFARGHGIRNVLTFDQRLAGLAKAD